jgi:hypothetical protein
LPKYEIVHPEGKLLDADIKNNLLKYFKNPDIQRLERLGGRILISVTAPYVNRKQKGKNDIVIDNNFVNELDKSKASTKEINSILNKLTISQLRKLSNLMGQPVRSNAKAIEIRAELIKTLQAEDIWQRISK